MIQRVYEFFFYFDVFLLEFYEWLFDVYSAGTPVVFYYNYWLFSSTVLSFIEILNCVASPRPAVLYEVL